MDRWIGWIVQTETVSVRDSLDIVSTGQSRHCLDWTISLGLDWVSLDCPTRDCPLETVSLETVSVEAVRTEAVSTGQSSLSTYPPIHLSIYPDEQSTILPYRLRLRLPPCALRQRQLFQILSRICNSAHEKRPCTRQVHLTRQKSSLYRVCAPRQIICRRSRLLPS